MSAPSTVAVEQPDSFAFDSEHGRAADKAIARYPEGRQASAVLPLLDLAQRQYGGWVPQAAIEHIAGRLGMAKIRVMEVATFYTMINLAPVGRYHLQVCGTTPCMLRGVGEVFRAIRDETGIGPGETSEDGLFTCTEVECLGACVNAPMVQVNDDFVEDLTYENFASVLRTLKNGGDLPSGSQVGRQSSEPEDGARTLIEVPPPPPFDPAVVYGLNGAGAPVTAETPTPAPAENEGRPAALDAPREGKADALTRIKGLGPRIEGALHGIGIYHFDQIAAWTPEEKDWVNGALKLGGRADRDDWVAQAADLAKADAGEAGA